MRLYDCRTCFDCGLYGGLIGTKYDGPWKWCECPTGVRRREREPGLVAEANTAREKLIRRFGSKPITQMVRSGGHLVVGEPRDRNQDEYHGDF